MKSLQRWAIVFAVAALLLPASAVFAQTVALMPNGNIVVAHEQSVEVFAAPGRPAVHGFFGVTHPGAVAASDGYLAVVDPLANSAKVIDLQTRRAPLIKTGETPIAAVFVGDALFILCRDSRSLEVVSSKPSDGSSSASVATTGAGAEFLRVSGNRLFVYARVDGLLQEFSAKPFGLVREVRVAPFASDFEVDGDNAYLVYPREGVVRLVSLATGKPAGQTKVGAVPVDLAITSGGTALTARTIAVADPASRRVWMIEGKQSVWEAFGRGFLRGLLGLGLFGGGQSAFSTGVDRVLARGSFWIAYDSSSGTLYRFTKSRNTILGKDIAPAAFALTPTGAVYWKNGTLVAAEQGR